jgi:hypothetical protein
MRRGREPTSRIGVGSASDRGDDASYAEDMQVAMYDAGGGYDYHHDGFGRYLTVLSYLNGVGGTYFPFGDDEDDRDGDDDDNDAAPSSRTVACGGRTDDGDDD